MNRSARRVLALGGGFALSFAAFGVLWIGTPWPRQALMSLPFLVLSYFVSKGEDPGDGNFLLVLCGALPLGSIIVRFRDKNDSHLMPIMIAASWLAGILIGRLLVRKAD